MKICDCVKKSIWYDTRVRKQVEAKVTGDVKANIIFLVSGNQPQGYVKLTLRLFADRLVKLGHIDS